MKLIESGKPFSFGVGAFLQNCYENEKDVHFCVYFFNKFWYWKLKNRIIKPEEHWVDLSGESWATLREDGRKGYTEYRRKKYGFYIGSDRMQFCYGVQEDFSWPNNAKDITFHYSWLRNSMISTEYLDRFGNKIYIIPELKFKKSDTPEQRLAARDSHYDFKKAVEKSVRISGTLLDYDGEEVNFTASQSYSVYRKFSGKFKIFGYLFPLIRYRHIRIEFDKEVGPEKCSWKGGTLVVDFPVFNDLPMKHNIFEFAIKENMEIVMLDGEEF